MMLHTFFAVKLKSKLNLFLIRVRDPLFFEVIWRSLPVLATTLDQKQIVSNEF